MRALGLVLGHLQTVSRFHRTPYVCLRPTIVRRFTTERIRKKGSREPVQPPSPTSELSLVDDEVVDKPGSLRRTTLRREVTPIRTIEASQQLNGTVESWKWLTDLSPGFAVHGSQVTVIHSPARFYETLIEKSKSAKRRITFASLYLGTGKLEQDLVNTIRENHERNPNLQVKWLLDYARGSRGDNSSRTMLSPLLQSTGQDCQVYLYHTPTLRGTRKRILPQRWNELIGLQHMKVYIFDDSVLITGANLSNDYFTNRQDRYFLIENCPELADFFDGLITEVTKFSFKLDKSNQVHLDPQWTLHPAKSDVKEFVQAAQTTVVSYYEECRKVNHHRLKDFFKSDSSQAPEAISIKPKHSTLLNSSASDTWIFPLIQMGPFHISYDEQATTKIFEGTEPGSTIKLATGYFNLTGEYVEKIISISSSKYEILMAHPKANGFLGAKGPAGGIPAAYTLLATRFFNKVKDSGTEHRIQMWEYVRPSWTFHGKGLWLYPTGQSLPFVTLIGSPNFGYRSVYRDLEAQLYIITRNPELRSELHEEQKHLYSYSESFSEHVFSQKERIVPLWVHMVIKYFKNFF